MNKEELRSKKLLRKNRNGKRTKDFARKMRE